MELQFWAATDTGRVRDHNEDNFLVDKKLQLFVVCDGMGGHAAGEVASAICVRTVREVIADNKELLARLRDTPDDAAASQALQDLLQKAVEMGNKRIFEMAQNDPSRHGMGTTCVALVLVGDRGFVGHVGDSRIYRMRDGAIEQITDDHSLLNEMKRQGKVAPETTEEEFPHNNAVTRAVGVREVVKVDAFGFDIAAGDRLLMCSDGLSEYFEGRKNLRDIIDSKEPKETTKDCIDHANQSGGKDNITVIVIDYVQEVVDQPETAEQRAEPGKAEVIELLRTTPFFHYLAPKELEQIHKMGHRIEVEADETLVSAEENSDRLFLILNGCVALQIEDRQITELKPGEHFGEMALIDAQDEHDATMVVRSVEPSILLAIEREQFVGLIRTDPGLAIKLLWNFVQVFADRLQSVPPEFRFTPEKWGKEPVEETEPVPESGALGVEDKLAGNQDQIGGQGSDTEDAKVAVASVENPRQPAKTPMTIEPPAPGITEDRQNASDSDETDLQRSAPSTLDELRKTTDLSQIDAEQLRGEAPKAGNSSKSTPVPKADNPSETPNVDRGLSSGTYDQSILEEGGVDEGQASIEDSEAPTPVPPGAKTPAATKEQEKTGQPEEDVASVSFGRPELAAASSSGAKSGEIAKHGQDDDGLDSVSDSESSAPNRKEDPLRKTMKLDWEDVDGDDGKPSLRERANRSTAPMDSIQPKGESESKNEAKKSADTEADSKTSRSSKKASSKKLKEKLQRRLKKRPSPSSGIMKKASGQKANLGEEKNKEDAIKDPPNLPEQSPPLPQDEGQGPDDTRQDGEPSAETSKKNKRASIAGESEAVENKKHDADEPAQPKIMISPDLMADAGDEQ